MLRSLNLVFLILSFFTLVSNIGNTQVVISFSINHLKDFHEGRNGVLKKEIELLNRLNDLTKGIENKATVKKGDIDKFTDEIVKLTELSAKNLRYSIPVKSGLETVISEKDIEWDGLLYGLYVNSLMVEMLDVLEISGVYRATSNERAKFNVKANEFDERLSKLINKYTRLWLRDIQSGDEYNKVLAEYRKLISDILYYNISFYEAKVKSADSSSIAKLQKLRSDKINTEIRDRLVKIEENTSKLNKFR